MILPIVRYGAAVLRQKGKAISELTPEILQLIQDMQETMQKAKGVGLAAQQVGYALQLAIVDVTGITERPSQLWMNGQPTDPESIMPLILINPEISGTKTKVVGTEGCLSFPGINAEIARSKTVRVKTRTLEGTLLEFEAAGLLGRAIQHEYDHLQGRLFIDHLTSPERKELMEEYSNLSSSPE